MSSLNNRMALTGSPKTNNRKIRIVFLKKTKKTNNWHNAMKYLCADTSSVCDTKHLYSLVFL